MDSVSVHLLLHFIIQPLRHPCLRIGRQLVRFTRRLGSSPSSLQALTHPFLLPPPPPCCCPSLSPLPPRSCEDGTTVIPWGAPKRSLQLARMQEETFDLVIIGGGCVGAGCAWEASTRGLKVALIERDDFAAGTSGRSTKLIHGGIRYLEAAVKNFDKEMYHLVSEALAEVSS
jgi:hypothetical protein